MPSKHQALRSNPTAATKKKKKERPKFMSLNTTLRTHLMGTICLSSSLIHDSVKKSTTDSIYHLSFQQRSKQINPDTKGLLDIIPSSSLLFLLFQRKRTKERKHTCLCPLLQLSGKLV
jgi:hypothetical protein